MSAESNQSKLLKQHTEYMKTVERQRDALASAILKFEETLKDFELNDSADWWKNDND